MRNIIGICVALLLPAACFAWNGHEVAKGGLRVLIEEVPQVTATDTPVAVQVVLENTGDDGVTGSVTIRDLVDGTRVEGADSKPFELAQGATSALQFAVVFPEGTYSALYPVHAYVQFTRGDVTEQVHAVRIVQTKFTATDTSSLAPTAMQAAAAPLRGALPLWALGTHRVAWNYYDKPMHYKPSGWTGSDSLSRASMGVTVVTRGEARGAINMHPTWGDGGGTVMCDYLLSLPATEPIKLTFANAIRDHSQTEPPSDGVLFRVWAAEGVGAENPQLLYEDFTDAKVWKAGEADLTPYAGRTILLRLESHPGPDRNTTCDSSYWAEPTVITGPQPEHEPDGFEQAVADTVQVGRRLLLGTLKPDNRFTFIIGQGASRTAAVFKPTQRGLVDGVLSLVGSNSHISFDGFDIDIMGQRAVRRPSAVECLDYATRVDGRQAVHTHSLRQDGRQFDFKLGIAVEGDGLRIVWDCPRRVTDFALGSADQTAPAVYYGHGYRIVNPKGFRAGFGGHNLSTSHVGCDFSGGMSLVQAVDVPPNYFEVNPGAKRYALHTHMNGTMTLVPSERGAFDCAIKYRPLYDKQPAGGVARKAGRMCFDIWGGRYEDIADNMAQMIRYGLTDSLLTVHAWQRWGYDYRLPDIWPPNNDFGTVEDMRKIGQVCEPHDIPWGLHDNYIDFYPDATGYTYDHTCFTQTGRPIKAWLNEGREAQSYRWRPDCFMPFLKRNLRAIKQGVAPTAYFIDVFTSAGCFDFYDHEGNFHPSTETRRYWGEAFAWIREYLGNNAPTSSEAGHDQLTGYLDGADCQHLTLTDKPQRHMIHIPCEDWERVPWYDAVNHARFILHGVGYSTRYQGGRDRNEHGINSDDYICAEILEGHALMVDAASWGRQAVRKYWLAQPVARNLALRAITNVEFVDGDMRRAIVTWDNGTKVYVNRGEMDWNVEGSVLPQYGYLVLGGQLKSVIEKREGVYCESSESAGGHYCNARTDDPDRRVRIHPRLANFSSLGEGKIRYDMVWQADEPAPRDMRVFVHFYSDRLQSRNKIAFQDDHTPSPGTKAWAGEVRYQRTVTIPEDARGEYQVVFGLYDSRGRLPLRGTAANNSGGSGIWVGTLNVTREDGRPADVTLIPPPPPKERGPSRVNLEVKPVDFGFALTDGAFRIEKLAWALRVTPLPETIGSLITLRLAQLGMGGRTPQRVRALDWEGDQLRPAEDIPFQAEGDEVTFAHSSKAFAYEVAFP